MTTTALHAKYGLAPILNAWGKSTLYGVGPVAPGVADAVLQCLPHCFDMRQLQRLVGTTVAQHLGNTSTSSPLSACASHCAAGAITVAAAACMTHGLEEAAVASLPQCSHLPRNRVLIQAPHCISYGQPIEQAVRLSGASLTVAPAGSPPQWFHQECAKSDVAAVVAVESSLCTSAAPPPLPTHDLVTIAHAHSVPVIVDAAAQDQRMADVMSSGVDLAVFSATKYLGSTTCGLTVGDPGLVAAMVQHLDCGIGRGFKPTKEGIFGLLAALEHRQLQQQQLQNDSHTMLEHVEDGVAAELRDMEGIDDVRVVQDAAGAPVWRLYVTPLAMSAVALAEALRARRPAVVVAPHALHSDNAVVLELTNLQQQPEIRAVLDAIREETATRIETEE